MPFLAVRNIGENIALDYSTISQILQMKNIACKAHYKVVALTLRHLSQKT